MQGWVKIHSFTDPITNIIGYRPWRIKQGGRWHPLHLLEGRPHGKTIVAHIEAVDTRDAAAQLTGQQIAIKREQLPEPGPEQYYWVQLEGLSVVTTCGQLLGRVDHLLETGANDVLVVTGDRERLIPYLYGTIIKKVDTQKGEIQVDWDPEY